MTSRPTGADVETPSPANKDYLAVRQFALDGRIDEARSAYQQLLENNRERSIQSLIENDLGVMAAIEGKFGIARNHFRASLVADPSCRLAIDNLSFLDEFAVHDSAYPPINETPAVSSLGSADHGSIRIAVVSFLFGWPSAGGGIMHTVEMATALLRAGYRVRHFYPRYHPWSVGRVEDYLPLPSEALEFKDAEWTRESIQDRFRIAVESFAPDIVLITDSWNFKPWLAEALREFPYVLVVQAQETLCPLNNIRFLQFPGEVFRQCPRHQLATPDGCRECVAINGMSSGPLHRLERDLSGVGSAAYDRALRSSFIAAKAVMVMNPIVRSLLEPYSDQVIVAPAAIDSSRFPWPAPKIRRPVEWGNRTVIFFAGVVAELIKGFLTLHRACELLWRQRQDFVLVATGEPTGPIDAFTRFIGWIPQEELPFTLHQADICVVPSIAQESFGRTAAEAMAAGKPVVASRLGGLPFTVAEGMTGLLFAPGDANDLASKLRSLLNDAELRDRMGLAGRKRFDSEFTWDVVLERCFKPLFCRRPSRIGENPQS